MPIPLVIAGLTLSSVSRSVGSALVGEAISRGIGELEKFYKGEGALDRKEAKEKLRKIEMEKYEIDISADAELTKAKKAERLKSLDKEKNELSKKYKLTKDEKYYEQAIGRIEFLNEKAKYGSLNKDQEYQLSLSKDIAHRIKSKDADAMQDKEMLIEEQTIKANIAGYNNKKKAQQESAKAIIQIEIEARRQAEERIKAEAKEFDDNMKKKEEAMKSLAEFDKNMKIASLDGEAQKQAQLLANYEKQKAEIKAMHEAQLLYAENEEQIFQEQANRMLEMERQYQEQSQAIKDGFAEIDAQRRAAEDEAARSMTAQRKREEEELRDLKYQTAAATMNTISNIATLGAALSENHKEFAVMYKASAIGEAVINATQSVLKTMAGTPFPFNIPLAAAQATAAAVQVQKISATKMYRGGMIPGTNTLIMANEQGREAILNTCAVRAVGGEAGVNALNRGSTYDNSRTSTINISMNTSIMTQKAFRDEIEPILQRAERRR